MDGRFVAKATILIRSSVGETWNALVNPDQIRRYMFGAAVVSDWSEGSRIVWRGEWEGREYEDRGVILKLEPERVIRYTHFSPLSGLPDAPANYHTVAVELTAKGNRTLVSLSQDNNATKEQQMHSEKNWSMMLENLKNLLENPAH